jgi:competence protein ComEA
LFIKFHAKQGKNLCDLLKHHGGFFMSTSLKIGLGILAVILLGISVAIYRYYRPATQGLAEAPVYASAPSHFNKKKAPAGKTSTSNSCTVHIAGLVVHPGLYTVPEGIRIVDALTYAGGTIPGADLDKVKLASKVKDGQTIVIKAQDYLTKANSKPSSKAKREPDIIAETLEFPLSLNTCSEKELEAIPGISSSLAKKVVAYREKWGQFYRIEELTHIKGLSPKKVEAIRRYLSL